jgi:hypothetical protein
MTTAVPTPGEEEELFVLLKKNEADLTPLLLRFLNRLEKSLYMRLTVEQIEELKDA